MDHSSRLDADVMVSVPTVAALRCLVSLLVGTRLHWKLQMPMPVSKPLEEGLDMTDRV
jgi:hypothetical protein